MKTLAVKSDPSAHELYRMVGGKIMKTYCKYCVILLACLSGCQSRTQCPKESSYLIAMQILRTSDEHDSFDKIKMCDDITALRIIAFTAIATAWPMEAGPNVDFDNKMDGIFQMAMQRLFEIDSDGANETIESCKHAFSSDGAYSLFFTELESVPRVRP